MTTKRIPKPRIMWGYYNMGFLIGVERTRREAIEAVEDHTGYAWETARLYMEVHKVRVAAHQEPNANE